MYTRLPRSGPWSYVAAVQYFLVQVLVASRFRPSYSLAGNTISDLGNTGCGVWNGGHVCSPLHTLMNTSFVVLGLTVVIGSALVYPIFNRVRGTAVGFTLFAVGGSGVVLVGIFPEDAVPALHGTGAALPFLVGNLALVLLGRALDVPLWLRLYTALSGVVALAALVYYVSSHHLGLGQGGVERVVAYPQTVWQVVFGLSALAGRRPSPPAPVST